MFSKLLQDHMDCFESLAGIQTEINAAADMMLTALKAGNTILVAGNGGSAADSQHFAAELIGRFEKERNAYPAIALTTDTSILTAIGNDYGYDRVFVRQVEGLGRPGDVLIGISTSGNSQNLILAAGAAREKGLHCIGLLGNQGGKMRDMMDIPVTISNPVTARIQEAHSFILHYWAAFLENNV